MEQTKPTPGLWSVAAGGKLPPWVVAGGVKVATVDTSAAEAGERAANARLIAAAPQLAEALSRCLAELEGIAKDCEEAEVDDNRIVLARAALKAAGWEGSA